MASDPPLIIGHRGAPALLPEHTAASYLRAIAAGVDAVEPDIVFSRDGVAVVRHENEISETTDVADRPEFASRRTRKTVDGRVLEGWFAEDFTWDELATLRCRERIPLIRPQSAAHDDVWPMLRLSDLLTLLDQAGAARGRAVGLVAEIKHAQFFSAHGFDVAGIVAATLRERGWGMGDAARPLWIESFERTALGELRAQGIAAQYIYLMEAHGVPADLLARWGEAAPSYAAQLSDIGALAAEREAPIDGISLDKSLLLGAAGAAEAGAIAAALVERAHATGLSVFTWTARAENAFLHERHRLEQGHLEQGRLEQPPTGSRHDEAGATLGDWRTEWAALRASGIDGVFVDDPERGVEFFGGGARA